jgi:C-terminal processing protease CtpA/Prc
MEAEAQVLADRELAEGQAKYAEKQKEALEAEEAKAVLLKKVQASVQRAAAPAPPTRPLPTPVIPVVKDVPIFVAPPEEEPPKRKKKIYDLTAAQAEVGILYGPNALGIVIAGFRKDSDAANSELMTGDLIIQADDNFLAGLPAMEAFTLLCGEMNSTVELTLTRKVKGVKTRVVTDVKRDVISEQKKADAGFDFKCEPSGLRVLKVYEGTSAFEELQKDDLITEIDDEFIAGLPLSEVKELLSGPARSSVVLGFSRLEKGLKRRCCEEVLFDHRARPVDLAEYSAHGEPGLVYATDSAGLKVTGFKKGTQAASSELKIGDVITQVEDELIAGLPPYVAFDKMSGDRDTDVELVARRTEKGAKMRIVALVSRDVGCAPKVGRPGFEVFLDPNGLLIDSIVEGSEAADEDLEPGDVITMINDDFISGMDMKEAWPLLWGEKGSQVELSITRQTIGGKSRVSASVPRDHAFATSIPKPPSAPLVQLPRALRKATPKKTTRSVLPASAPASAPATKAESGGKSVGSGSILMVAILVLVIALAVHCHLLAKSKGIGLSKLEFKDVFKGEPGTIAATAAKLASSALNASSTAAAVLKPRVAFAAEYAVNVSSAAAIALKNTTTYKV